MQQQTGAVQQQTVSSDAYHQQDNPLEAVQQPSVPDCVGSSASLRTSYSVKTVEQESPLDSHTAAGGNDPTASQILPPAVLYPDSVLDAESLIVDSRLESIDLKTPDYMKCCELYFNFTESLTNYKGPHKAELQMVFDKVTDLIDGYRIFIPAVLEDLFGKSVAEQVQIVSKVEPAYGLFHSRFCQEVKNIR